MTSCFLLKYRLSQGIYFTIVLLIVNHINFMTVQFVDKKMVHETTNKYWTSKTNYLLVSTYNFDCFFYMTTDLETSSYTHKLSYKKLLPPLDLNPRDVGPRSRLQWPKIVTLLSRMGSMIISTRSSHQRFEIRSLTGPYKELFMSQTPE